MLSQVFTAFSCHLFEGLSAFSFVSSYWKACSIRLRSGDWLGHWRISHYFASRRSLVVFTVCFGSLSTLRIRHASSISIPIIIKHLWNSSTGSHLGSWHNIDSTMFDVIFQLQVWGVFLWRGGIVCLQGSVWFSICQIFFLLFVMGI